MIGGNDDGLAAARGRLAAAVGSAGLVDAGAVAALFDAIDRLADATAIPLEAHKADATADFRADLGIDLLGGHDEA